MDQTKVAKVTHTIKSIFFNLATPIIKELPYIVIFMCMMDYFSQDLRTIQSTVIGPRSYYIAWANVFVLFLYAYIGASIVTFVRSKVLKYICKTSFYLITVLLFFISHFLLTTFNLSISPTCLVLLAETNPSESSEFINQFIFSENIIPTINDTSICLIVIVVAELLWNLVVLKYIKFHFIIKTIISSITTIAILFSSYYFTSCVWRMCSIESADVLRYIEPPSDPFSSILSSSITVHKMKSDMRDAVELNQHIASQKNSVITSNDSLNVVVVIGESFVKHYSELYGYPLKTNPYLAQEQKNNNLFVFNDVIASSNQTSIVLRNILCCNNSSDDEIWHKYPYFPSIFKSSGYNVYFWSNQIDSYKMETFSFTLNSFLYDPLICKLSYTQRNTEAFQYDEALINSFSNTVDFKSNKHNLIMFHLNGQHHNVRHRFPCGTDKRFNVFTADSIKRNDSYLGLTEKEYIADYNNATLYNDYVLYKTIELFRDSNTIILYFSDHGDVVYSYMKQCGRDHAPLYANKVKYQYEVPFMIWCSETYKEKYPEQVENIKNAVNRPFLSDNICNMLFNVANIETPYYRDSLDLISPNYKSKKRVLNHKYVYEDIRYTIP